MLRRHPVFFFYAITFALSGLATVLAFFVFHGNLSAQWVATWSPALTACILTGLIDGKEGMRSLLARLFRWRIGWRWYLAVIGLSAAFALVWIFLNQTFKNGDASSGFADMAAWLRAVYQGGPGLLIMVPMMSVLIIGEEIGWRGFALERLLKNHSPWASSAIVGFFWGIWHIPSALDSASVLNKAPLSYSIPLFTLGTIVFSFVYTWMWMNTGGSLLVICLFHGVYDLLNYFTAALFPDFYVQFWVYLIGMAIVMLPIAILGRIRMRPVGRAVNIPG